jgi:hypothetical protein
LGGDEYIYVSVRDSLLYVLELKNMNDVFLAVLDDDYEKKSVSRFALSIMKNDTYNSTFICMLFESQKVCLTNTFHPYILK